MPSNALLEMDIVRNHGSRPEWSDDELATLSRRFWVSWEVILRRLLILRRTTRSFYEHWRKERNDLFPGHDTHETAEIKIPTSTRVIMRNGKLFPSIVFRALRNRRITSFEASEILSAAPHRLGEIEGALF